MQRLSAITHAGFGLFRVRSPLLTESRLFSFPVGTEMFHFPTFPPTTLCVQVEVAGHYSGFFRGFPIRRSPDRSSFTSSPGLIAGYNVLHRLLMPRHPPTALSSLSPNKTINKIYKDARVHYTILKQQPQPNQTPAQTRTPSKTRTTTKPTTTLHTPKQHAKNSRKFQNPTTCTPNTTPTTTNVPHPPK